jgi:fatty-acyl-CoA synthase
LCRRSVNRAHHQSVRQSLLAACWRNNAVRSVDEHSLKSGLIAFDGPAPASWLDGQPDLSPKWQPRFVRVGAALPSTPTNKILTRTLVHEKFRSDRVGGDALYRRARGEPAYYRFDAADEAALREEFVAHGRLAAWDL